VMANIPCIGLLHIALLFAEANPAFPLEKRRPAVLALVAGGADTCDLAVLAESAVRALPSDDAVFTATLIAKASLLAMLASLADGTCLRLCAAVRTADRAEANGRVFERVAVGTATVPLEAPLFFAKPLLVRVGARAETAESFFGDMWTCLAPATAERDDFTSTMFTSPARAMSAVDQALAMFTLLIAQIAALLDQRVATHPARVTMATLIRVRAGALIAKSEWQAVNAGPAHEALGLLTPVQAALHPGDAAGQIDAADGAPCLDLVVLALTHAFLAVGSDVLMCTRTCQALAC